MFLSIVPHLRCPDGGELALDILREEFHPARKEGEVIEGTLTSKKTGIAYPIRDGIPRLLPKEFDTDTQSRFEMEWQHWARGKKIYGMDTATYKRDLFERRSGRPLTDAYFKDKVVLEGGCGHGMAGEIIAPLAKDYFGIDLGAGIDAARQRTRHLGNVHLIQGSLLSLPLAAGVCDFVFSIGVIHHTPDPHKAFSELCRAVRRNGEMLIWVYPKEGVIFETLSGMLRTVTTRLPARAVYLLAYALVPMLYIRKPYADSSPSKNTWHENMQSVYDWLSPKYQFHYSPEELRKWFAEFNFKDTASAPVATGILGRKS